MIVLEKIETEADLNRAIEIRKEVFVKEQNVPIEEEVDEYDVIDYDKVIHFLLLEDNQVIGTLRLINKTEYVKIGRVVISKNRRKQGLGKKLLVDSMNYIENNKLFDISNKYFFLEGQIQAIGFYNKLGFTEYGEEFLDAGIKHKKMKREI